GDAAFAFSLSMHNAVAAALHGAGSPELIATWGDRLRTGNALGGLSLRPTRGVARRGPALRPRPAGIRPTGARLPGHPLDAGRRRHRARGVTPAGCGGSGAAGYAPKGRRG